MEEFDYKKFLVENKLTSNSQLNETPGYFDAAIPKHDLYLMTANEMDDLVDDIINGLTAAGFNLSKSRSETTANAVIHPMITDALEDIKSKIYNSPMYKDLYKDKSEDDIVSMNNNPEGWDGDNIINMKKAAE